MSTLVVIDDTTRDELELALTYQCKHAKRQPCILGVTQPSNWDVAHGRIDALLDEWRTASRRQAGA